MKRPLLISVLFLACSTVAYGNGLLIPVEPDLPPLAMLIVSVALVASAACGRSAKQTSSTKDLKHYSEKGVASWYGKPFHGRTTANGERYDMSKMTAAHRTLPFDVMVRVTNLDNGRSVKVRINDRGPFVDGRIIDLSRAAAKKLDLYRPGTGPVRIEVVNY